MGQSRHKRIFFPKSETKIVIGVLLFSLIVRILLFPIQGYRLDLATFYAWFSAASENGLRIFYKVIWCDYPPLNVYLFWILGLLASSLSSFWTNSVVYVIKLPPNLFDVATAFLIFTFLRKRLDFNSSLLFTSLYAFNPATIFNASVWGQYDAIYTFFLVLSLILILESKSKLSVTALTLGILTKPQSIALAPIIAFLIHRKERWKGLISAFIVSVVTVLIVILPFEWSNPIEFLSNIYLGGYGGYSYSSINAFNVWAFSGFWKPDTQPSIFFFNPFTTGWALFMILTVFSLYYLHLRLQDSRELFVLFSGFVLLFGFFMLPTRIHERYLFPAFSVLAMTLPFHRKMRLIYCVLTFTYLSNQAYVLSFLNSGNYIPDLDPFVWIVAFVNLASFLYSLIYMLKK